MSIHDDGENPVEFVISQNVKRRHLTAYQRAKAGRLLAPYFEEKAQERMESAGERGKEGGRGKRKTPTADRREGFGHPTEPPPPKKHQRTAAAQAAKSVTA